MNAGSDSASDVAPLLVVLLGPTASGKTELSLYLAERFNGEIVSCDSVAVYRGMDIGAAKPSRQERARVPHHLLDVAWPDRAYTAGDYSRDARAAIADITARGRLPIVTGGSGLYLRALLDGLFAGPQRSEPLRARLRASGQRRGAGWLHRLLQRIDPISAERIHANDEAKLIRALEVAISMREPLSTALAAPGGRDPLTGYRILRLGLQPDRARLYERINVRAGGMFAAGLMEETRGLMAAWPPTSVALGALGYRQAAAVLVGQLSVDEAVAEARQGHRNYAKRQMTWFRREPEVLWLAGFGGEPAVQAAALEAVSARLSGGPG
jgi:tRNA dimethylallyltransferase